MKYNEVKLPSNKKFGFFFSVIFLAVCIYFFLTKVLFASFIFGIFSFFLFVITLIKPNILTYFNKLWMKFGLILGIIISPIILGIIFFGLFVSTAIIMRIFGRDLLNLKFKKKVTYWKSREVSNTSKINFNKQF